MSNLLKNTNVHLVKQSYFNFKYQRNITFDSGNIYILKNQKIGISPLDQIIANTMELNNSIFNCNIEINIDLIVNSILNILEDYTYLNKIKFESKENCIRQNKIIFNFGNEFILEPDFGFDFFHSKDKFQFLGWDNDLQQFVQKDESNNYLEVEFDSDITDFSYSCVDKSGDTVDYVILQRMSQNNLYSQVTKEYVDNYISSSSGLNHDTKYISYTGRNMENTTNLKFNGIEKEVQINGTLRLLKQPIQNNHQQNLEYQNQKYNIFANHKHNQDYVLLKESESEPNYPIKENYFTLGKDQNINSEFIRLKQVANIQQYHNHDYLWKETNLSATGDTITGTDKFKNVVNSNLYYSTPYDNIDNIILNSNDSVIKQYIDKIKNPNYGKLFIGYYDFMRGNSINEGQTIASIDLTGWYEYYKQKINLNLSTTNFIVFPIITLLDFVIPNKQLQNTWNIGNQINSYPHLGYHGQSKFNFGKWNYPDESKRYIIDMQLNSQDIIYDIENNYSLSYATSGYFQNFRIYLIGGAIGYQFKYYDSFVDFLDNSVKI